MSQNAFSTLARIKLLCDWSLLLGTVNIEQFLEMFEFGMPVNQRAYYIRERVIITRHRQSSFCNQPTRKKKCFERILRSSSCLCYLAYFYVCQYSGLEKIYLSAVWYLFTIALSWKKQTAILVRLVLVSFIMSSTFAPGLSPTTSSSISPTVLL